MKVKLPVFVNAANIVLLLGVAPVSFAVDCVDQTLTDGHFYEIYVPERKWCNLYNVTVGYVHADKALSLAMVGSTVYSGGIRVEAVRQYVWLDGNLFLDSNIDVLNSHGVRLTFNQVKDGSVVVSGNRGESRWATTFATGNSIIGGDLIIKSNSGAYVLRNNVSGTFQCDDNHPLIRSGNTAGVSLACVD